MAEPAQGDEMMEVKEEDPVRKLEEMVAKTTGASLSENNLASPEVSYVGSMIDEEGVSIYPKGMRHRVVEAPLGRKVGYHELGDEAEEADVEWMTGEASQVSGGGVRGSRNWCLMIVFPIFLITAIICMHNWWWEIRKAFSHMADKTADALDRRLETVGDAMVAGIADVGGDSSEAREEQLPRSLAVEGAGDAAEAEGRTHSLHEKVVYTLDLSEKKGEECGQANTV